MHSIEILMSEHRNIERVVEALETAAAHLSNGTAVRPAFFTEAAGFFADYADGVHHAKEEGVLFGAIVESGMPKGEGPIPIMLEEHVEARACTRALRRAGKQLEAGAEGAVAEVVASARKYAALIRDHIAKEDDVLFPMAAQMMSLDTETQVVAGMARLEAQETGSGKLHALLALADALEAEAAQLTAR